MLSTGRIAALVLAVLLLTASASAEEVVVKLRTGSRLRGEIVKEDAQEIELKLADGMRMKVRRALIVDITKVATSDPNDEPVVPDPDPEPEPPPPPPDPTAGQDGTPPVGDPLFFEKPAAVDWDVRFSRVPTITAAKLSRFRAYEYVAHSPLAVSPNDPEYRDHVLAHGHGGCLSSWDFRYIGNLELRYGDEVKFVAEITSPEEEDLLLIRLQEGPSPVTERLVVMLVRHENQVRRYATTTIFDNRAFRQADLTALADRELPIRTWTSDYEPVTRRWLTEAESEFLREIRSPFGNSLRIRLERYRFRLDWFAAAPESRPGLDPELLRRHAVRPIALPGRSVASEEYVRAMWGTEEANREGMAQIRGEFRTLLAGIGVQPDRGYYVEQDLIGVRGRNGVTVETRRVLLTEALLRELAGE